MLQLRAFIFAITHLHVKKSEKEFLKYFGDALSKHYTNLRGMLKYRSLAFKSSARIASNPCIDYFIEIFLKECKMPSNIVISVPFLRVL